MPLPLPWPIQWDAQITQSPTAVYSSISARSSSKASTQSSQAFRIASFPFSAWSWSGAFARSSISASGATSP